MYSLSEVFAIAFSILWPRVFIISNRVEMSLNRLQKSKKSVKRPKIKGKKKTSQAKKGSSGGFWRFLVRWTFRLGFLALVIGAAFYYWLFHHMPTLDPDQQYTRANIMKKLASETSVYYRDGETFMGSFFASEHRRYVPYEKIPERLVQAIVAGEDGDFFEHNGFNPKGFARAMLSNIKAGRVVQGGSTLTQQTAKNIFGRQGRSFMVKYNELVQALRLEHHFSKQQILEFYLNQFYVTGTGRGVGIAAQYFFNKPLKELSTRQLAFIAGSVKGPHNYDPFIQKNQKRYERALKKGQYRIEYILGRMLKENFITEAEYQKAMKAPTQFSRGNFRSPLTTGMNQLLQVLSSDPFQEIWEDHDIESWQDAHLKIVSTLDPEVQRGTHMSLRKNLTRLALSLETFKLPKRKSPSRAQSLTQGEAFYAEVSHEDAQGLHLTSGRFKLLFKKSELDQFEKYGLKSGVKANRQLFTSKSWKQTGEILRVVAMEEARTPTEKPVVEVFISVNGQIQGATGILNKGVWLASVGGEKDQDFDRVHHAKRQLGSLWKLPLYAKALELGWHMDDLLENTYNLFQFDDQFYYPNPDHKNRGDKVTIQWAGTRSENIASVWLLTHLLDKSDPSLVYDIAKYYELTPGFTESDREWFKRIRDKWGLTLNQTAAREVLFEQARKSLEKSKALDFNFEEADFLANYQYGRGFTKEMKSQAKQRNYDRVKLLKQNYLRDQILVNNMQANDPKIIYAKDSLGRTGFFLSQPDSSWTTIENPFHPKGDTTSIIDTFLGAIETLLPEQVEAPTGDDFWIEGRLQVNTFRKLKTKVDQAPKEGIISWFRSEKNYVYHPTLYQQLNMKVFADFCKKLGIREQPEEVLSMVLGATSVSLAEMIQVYQSLSTGMRWQSSQGSGAWVSRIEDSRGKVLYDLKTDLKPQQVLSGEVVSQVNMILESIVRNGTGRRADRQILVEDPKLKIKYKWPVGGKTGTTNGYRNAAFIGNVPLWDSRANALTWRQGAVVGAYVGFDNNKSMRRGSVRIGGSNGALPMWIKASQELIDHGQSKKQVDYLDLKIQLSGRIPVQFLQSVEEIKVDGMQGTWIPQDQSGPIVHWPQSIVEDLQ